MRPVRIVAGGVAVQSRPETGRGSCCFAVPCVLPNGRWLIGYREAADKETTDQCVKLTWSDDCGNSWCEPFDPFPDIPRVDGRRGSFRALKCSVLDPNKVVAALSWVDSSDPSRRFFDRDTECLLDCEPFLSESADGGATWSAPRRIEPACFTDQSKPLTGPLLCMPDGRWACQFELNKRYGDTRPWVHKPVLAFSRDRGVTWCECAVPAHDPGNRLFFWDQRPAVLPGGTILDPFWTWDTVGAAYLTIHACESRDSGRTWSPPWDTGLAGQPAPPVGLIDGRIVMVYVDRASAPAIRFRVSGDGGRTWPAATELTIFDSGTGVQQGGKSSTAQAWNEMVKFSVGLPQTTSLPDGRILVTYYAGPAVSQTDIRWTVLAPTG